MVVSVSFAGSEAASCAFTWMVTRALPDLKARELVPAFLAVTVQVPSPLSVAVDVPSAEFSAVMVPVAPSGRAVTVIFTGSFTLQAMLLGVAMILVIGFSDGLMVPVVSS